MIALILIILLGFFLRIHHINRFALRGDEAFTVIHWMREPFAQTLATIATVDPQPPLAYAVYRAWSLMVGSQEWIVRYLPALTNVIGIAVLYALGKRLANGRVGIAAALLWAIQPFQIWHAQDARNYALWGAFSPLALWLGLRALYRPHVRDWALYVGAALLACYTYYLELFPLAALNLYVFLFHRRDRRLLIRWAAAQILIVIGLALWFLQGRLLYESGYGGTAGSTDIRLLLTWFIPTLLFGDTLPFPILWIAVLIVLLVGVVIWWIRDRPKAILLVLLSILPLIGLAVVSLRLNVFTPRYVLSVTVPLVLMLAIFVSKKKSRFLDGRFFVYVGSLALSVASIFSYFGLVNDYTKSPDWRALVTYLQARTIETDTVIQTAADEAFTFYFNEYRVAGEHLRLPANPIQTPEEIGQVLRARLDTTSSYWLVAQPPPAWENGETPREWFNDYTQIVRQTNVNGLSVRQFMSWEVSADERDPAPRAQFMDYTGSNSVSLYGVRVYAPDPTGALTVWLIWHPDSRTPNPLKSFVHVIGAINPASGTPLWSQDDQFPQDGRLSSETWSLNLPYRDVYVLPVRDLPTGTYALAVGWYDPETNQRLSLAGTDADFFIIQDVVLP